MTTATKNQPQPTQSEAILETPTLPVFLKKPTVIALVQITERTLDKWVGAGEFPLPKRIGKGRGVLRWKRDEVLAFLDASTDKTRPRT